MSLNTDIRCKRQHDEEDNRKSVKRTKGEYIHIMLKWDEFSFCCCCCHIVALLIRKCTNVSLCTGVMEAVVLNQHDSIPLYN